VFAFADEVTPSFVLEIRTQNSRKPSLRLRERASGVLFAFPLESLARVAVALLVVVIVIVIVIIIIIE